MKMEYFVLNAEKNVIFEKTSLKLIEKYKMLKLQGDNYTKYIYPLRNELNKINTRKELYDKLLNLSHEKNEDFSIFNSVLDKLLYFEILILINMDNALSKKVLIKKRLTIVSFIFHEYYLELCKNLEELFDYNIDIIILYEEYTLTTIDKIKEKNKNLKFCLVTDFSEICENLDCTDIIVSFNFQIDSPVNLLLSEWSKSCGKNILFCTFYNKKVVIGPMQDRNGYTCLECAIKNDIVKGLREESDVMYRKRIDSYTWRQCCLIIEKELVLLHIRSCSILQAAVILCDSLSCNQDLIPILKFKRCSQCH